MESLIKGAGLFIWPLLACSLAAVFILVERLIALQADRVIPRSRVSRLTTGAILDDPGDNRSVIGRILRFFHQNNPDPDALKAFAALEMARMERGLFVLDIVVSAAPLLGLLGTVAGLIDVFSAIDPATGIPDAMRFVKGIAMALSTTMLGLVIAIPALVGNSYLTRRVDLMSAQIGVGVERIIDLSAKRREANSPSRISETEADRPSAAI